MTIYLNLLVCIVGLLIFVLAKDPKTQEIGKIMFWVGLLTFLLGDQALFSVIRR